MSPLYTAPEADLSTMTFAFSASTAGFQPEIAPDSVAKRNRAGFPGAISKAGVPLKTCAVGAPAGIRTTRALAMGNGWPRPLYKVLVPDRLFEIQNGPVGFRAIPQGLVRFGSVCAANPGISETRF